MLFFTLGVYQNVVDKDNHELVQERSENTVHVVHEHRWCIGNTERHHKILVVTITSSERSLSYIGFLDSYLMITRLQIYLRENSGSPKLVHQIVNPWNRVTILQCDFIQLSVVST